MMEKISAKKVEGEPEAAKDRLRSNWPRRIGRGVLIAAAAAGGGVLGFEELEWPRWLGGVLGGALGLAGAEGFEWLERRADDKRLTALVSRTQATYPRAGEDAAKAVLRDGLNGFEGHLVAAETKLTEKVGDVEAVAHQATAASLSVDTRVDTLNGRVDGLETVMARLRRVKAAKPATEAKAKEGVTVDALPTKIETVKAVKPVKPIKPAKKAG
jgi:hypothetical protein